MTTSGTPRLTTYIVATIHYPENEDGIRYTLYTLARLAARYPKSCDAGWLNGMIQVVVPCADQAEADAVAKYVDAMALPDGLSLDHYQTGEPPECRPVPQLPAPSEAMSLFQEAFD